MSKGGSWLFTQPCDSLDIWPALLDQWTKVSCVVEVNIDESVPLMQDWLSDCGRQFYRKKQVCPIDCMGKQWRHQIQYINWQSCSSRLLEQSKKLWCCNRATRSAMGGRWVGESVNKTSDSTLKTAKRKDDKFDVVQCHQHVKMFFEDTYQHLLLNAAFMD